MTHLGIIKELEIKCISLCEKTLETVGGVNGKRSSEKKCPWGTERTKSTQDIWNCMTVYLTGCINGACNDEGAIPVELNIANFSPVSNQRMDTSERHRQHTAEGREWILVCFL